MPEQWEQDDDRDWYAQQPQQYATTHCCLHNKLRSNNGKYLIWFPDTKIKMRLFARSALVSDISYRCLCGIRRSPLAMRGMQRTITAEHPISARPFG
jgi:hypothetical protein